MKISMPDIVKQEKDYTKEISYGLLSSSLLAGLIAVGSKVSFPLPFTDVPVTLQVFFILVAGGLLGPGWGAFSVAEYLLVGAMGVPVFADKTIGAAALAGPTGGYLVGFLSAAAFVGYFVERVATKELLAFVVWLGAMLILLIGGIWLHFAHGRSWSLTLATGILPFLAVDTLKSIAAWAVIVRARKK